MEKYYISSNKYSISERKTKLRGKVYDIRFRLVDLSGNEIHKKISGFETKALAKQGYLEFVQEHCEFVRNSPVKKKAPEKEKLLVGDLVRQYMATLGNQNKYSSIYDKNNIFRIYILPKYENTTIDKLTKEELYVWQDELWATKNPRNGNYFSYKYLAKIRGQFGTFLTWVEQRYGIHNNLNNVIKPKRTQAKKEMCFWTRKQFDSFLSIVDDPTYHALFTFMFYTGRRKGELFALSKSDIKKDGIVINKSLTRKTLDGNSFGITSTKANKTQLIPICDIVKKEIANYKGGDKFYFGGDNPLADNTVRRKFIEYTEKSGLPRIRIHDLRHSFVSMLIHLGANFMSIADLIGDEVEQVIKTYGHLYQEDKLSILAKIK